MFACQLAMRLGMTVGQVFELPNTEWNLFWAFNRLSPIGDERRDLNAASVCAAVTNVHMGKGKRVTPGDFMPQFSKRRAEDRFNKKAFFRALDRCVEKDKARGT